MRATLLAALLALGGCDANPYCLNCKLPDGAPPADASERPDRTAVDLAEPPDLVPVEVDASCNPATLQIDPHNCGACGNECEYANAAGLCAGGKCKMGPCQPGYYDIDGKAANGCELACIPSNPPDEVCDGQDNDCNGKTDEGFALQTDPMNCGACGLACNFANASGDCVAGRCSIKSCGDGYRDLDGSAANGCEYACPVDPPEAEACNGKDDDCNGKVDDAPGDVGQACDQVCPSPAPCVAAGNCPVPTSKCSGRCCGLCAPGKWICAGGQRVCQGGTGPKLEVCDAVDNNCDGQVDEGFDTRSDPRNCGACGNQCSANHAVAGCASGKCSIVTCLPGYNDLDKNPANGCEFTCPVKPVTAESCNGKDDDCDGKVDNGLKTPPNLCNQTSLCAGTVPECGGAKGWICNYAKHNARIEVDAAGNLALTERLCDGYDGNCNTQVDESYPNKGKPCSAGTGACREDAVFACAANGLSTVCPATAHPDRAVDEQCNGIDDDCDGQVDERTPATGTLCFNGGQHACRGWTDAMAKVGSVWFYQYEAARPDATGSSTGTGTARACSRAGALPWSSVSWTQARDACAAVRDSAGSPMRLCTADEWMAACSVGSTANPIWAYASSPTTYAGATCNGADQGSGKPWVTGGGAACYANQSGGRLYDMSGNVAEWTSTSISVGGGTYYKVRGGAYNSYALGTSCPFDFPVQQAGYQFTDVGFRCCADHAP